MPESHQPLRIGLTGGIASGKSAVANLFGQLDVEIIDTDIIAREVVEPGSKGLSALRTAFGSEIIKSDGSLDRAALRAVAFTDDASRKQLEAILHPLIREETLRQSTAGKCPYQIIVVPLLIESGFVEIVDRVLVVDCSVQTQTERLMARDQESATSAAAMIAAQISREDRLAAADDVITNDGSFEDLAPAVSELHKKYLKLATDRD